MSVSKALIVVNQLQRNLKATKRQFNYLYRQVENKQSKIHDIEDKIQRAKENLRDVKRLNKSVGDSVSLRSVAKSWINRHYGRQEPYVFMDKLKPAKDGSERLSVKVCGVGKLSKADLVKLTAYLKKYGLHIEKSICDTHKDRLNKIADKNSWSYKYAKNYGYNGWRVIVVTK